MTKDMTSGNPLKLIFLFSIPVLLGNLFQQFYNMVDAIIVGRFLGEDALAAVGSTGSIVFLVLGFAMGIAQGFGVMISHAFGAKDEKRLKHYVAVSLILGLIISVVITAITLSCSRMLLLFMKTPENILSMANSYIVIIYSGLLATMFFNISSSILRGVGDSKTPLYFLIVSSVLNVALDLFFIVSLHMGPAGAALATVIAQTVAAALCFLYMFKKFDILKIQKEDFYLDLKSCRELLSIGVPMAVNYSVTAVGVMILQSAVNVFGSSVVAAYTAASKVEQLSSQPMITLGTTIATYCGQNLGAGKYRRIFDGMRKGAMIALGTALFAALVSVLLGDFIVRWFLSAPTDAVMAYTRQYLTTISCFYVPLVMVYFYRNALQGLDLGFMPMISGLFEMVCRIGVVMLLLKPAGFWSVCFASPTAWLGAGVPLLITYLLWKGKIKKSLPAE
ncbi:MAG: MATE family efflux transporter [Lachnospiraceae bacterium]|nr:MATE family efflux transporter [Lachnospiraceae bacterium]